MAAGTLDLLAEVGVGPLWRQRRSRSVISSIPGAGLEVYEEIWRGAAAALDGEVTDLGHRVLEIRRGAATTRVFRNLVMLDNPVSLHVSTQKSLVHRWLSSHGIPVPLHVEFDYRDLRPALDFLDARGGPCVIKPASGTGGGEGVTTGVRTPAQAAAARTIASRFDERILIEHQAVGNEYRLLFLDGKLLDAVGREPPSVVGDGRSTVDALIGAENAKRAAARGRAGLFPLRMDLDCAFAVAGAGLGLASVPPAGRRVGVKGTANDGGPNQNHGAKALLAPSLVAQAAAAMTIVGLRLGSVEVVTPDPGKDLNEAGGVLLEVNCNPGLHYHYQVANPAQAVPVAVPILETLLSQQEVKG